LDLATVCTNQPTMNRGIHPSRSNNNPNREKHYRITVTTTDAPPSPPPDVDRKRRGHPLTTASLQPPCAYSGDRTSQFFNAHRNSRPSHPWEQFRFPSATLPNATLHPPTTALAPSTRHRRVMTQDRATASSSSRTAETKTKKKHPLAVAPARHCLRGHNASIKIPAVISIPTERIEPLGPRHLRIFKVSLPFCAADTFHRVIDACEDHAWHRLDQWETNLYSLTKQDIAVADLPGGRELVQGVQDYVVGTIRRLYRQPTVHMDRNQPHVLKYDGDTSHRSVPLHHDQCHGTFYVLG
jgi:hypothetical protein